MDRKLLWVSVGRESIVAIWGFMSLDNLAELLITFASEVYLSV